jgi:DNA integrity scanning protein DisA with diadenylate cyclase activity
LANEHELRTMGSRHKSAFGFCQQWPNSLALVVSQDGDVTLFVRKNGGGVTQVPHLLTS